MLMARIAQQVGGTSDDVGEGQDLLAAGLASVASLVIVLSWTLYIKACLTENQKKGVGPREGACSR